MTMGKIYLMGAIIFLLSLFMLPASAEETLSVTTYYPSPYGSYRELSSYQIKVGHTYSSPNVSVSTDNLIVEGNVGIGVSSPEARLHLYAQPSSDLVLKMQNTSNAASDCDMFIIDRGHNAQYSLILWSTTSVTDWTAGVLYNGGSANSKFSIGRSTQINDSKLLIDTNGNVGIGVNNPNYTLQVSGTTWCSSGAWSGSDARWKEGIKRLSDPLAKLMKIRGVTFAWKRDEFKDNRFPSGKQIGILAQEMEKDFPELVTTDNNGYKAIAYDRFTAVLLEAIKSQQGQIEELKAELQRLRRKL